MSRPSYSGRNLALCKLVTPKKATVCVGCVLGWILGKERELAASRVHQENSLLRVRDTICAVIIFDWFIGLFFF